MLMALGPGPHTLPPYTEQVPTLRFGAFELDLAASELRKGGTLLKLAPQPFQVLRLLAENGGEICTRDTIRQTLWGDDTHVDFDRNLNVCMTQIRAVLSDDADAPRFIRTVPRRGYRFVAPVERIPPAVAAARPRFRYAIALGVSAAVLSVVAWRAIPRGVPASERLLIA